jgi:DNA (cytosine-5)-methyltransferase 1
VKKLTVGSLFAGIGGFDLGLERTGGFEIRWQVEIDEYCRRVLAKHWPYVKRYGDIRDVTDVEPVDVLCGGFPCQDISNAGKRIGIDGERSGLWSEFARLIRLVRPRYVLVENVAALLNRGIGRVLGDLSACGYDAEWDVIPASAVGAPHRRERVWIVAYASGSRLEKRDSVNGVYISQANSDSRQAVVLHCKVENSECERLEEPRVFGVSRGQADSIADAGFWATEPDVGRVAHGIPARVDRLKSLGNAVVPQVVEWIGNRILEFERAVEANHA